MANRKRGEGEGRRRRGKEEQLGEAGVAIASEDMSHGCRGKKGREQEKRGKRCYLKKDKEGS